jgi:hypothetical protein
MPACNSISDNRSPSARDCWHTNQTKPRVKIHD